jgi:hypothetical protein
MMTITDCSIKIKCLKTKIVFISKCKTLENIVYEVTLDKTKWLIYAIYRPPSMANDIFTNHMNILLDKGSKFIENYMVIDVSVLVSRHA